MKKISERVTELMQELNMDTKDEMLVFYAHIIYFEARVDALEDSLKQSKTTK